MPVVCDVAFRGAPRLLSAEGVQSLVGRFAVDPIGRHGDQEKPYRAGELVVDGEVMRWRLVWSACGSDPHWSIEDVLGSRLAESGPVPGFGDLRIAEVLRREVSFEELAAAGPVVSAGLWFRSPTVFRRGGRPGQTTVRRRSWPVLDPVLVVESVARGWNRWAPAGLALDRELVSGLLDEVFLRSSRCWTRRVGELGSAGEPAAVNGSVVDRQVGFVGEAVFGVSGRASVPVRRAFAMVMGFAGVFGVGAQRAFGFGDVEVMG